MLGNDVLVHRAKCDCDYFLHYTYSGSNLQIRYPTKHNMHNNNENNELGSKIPPWMRFFTLYVFIYLFMAMGCREFQG